MNRPSREFAPGEHCRARNTTEVLQNLHFFTHARDLIRRHLTKPKSGGTAFWLMPGNRAASGRRSPNNPDILLTFDDLWLPRVLTPADHKRIREEVRAADLKLRRMMAAAARRSGRR